MAERVTTDIGFITGGGETRLPMGMEKTFRLRILLIEARAMLQEQLRSPVRVNECLAATCNRTTTSKRRKISMVQTSANALREYAALNRRK